MCPNYDYGCLECDHVFDKILPIAKMDEPIDEPCPNCGKVGSIHKIIGSPMIHWTFMGSTIQSKTPDTFKDVLKEIKKKSGRNANGIE